MQRLADDGNKGENFANLPSDAYLWMIEDGNKNLEMKRTHDRSTPVCKKRWAPNKGAVFESHSVHFTYLQQTLYLELASLSSTEITILAQCCLESQDFREHLSQSPGFIQEL